MKRSYLCINTDKVEYLWIIKNFTDYLKFDNKNDGYIVKSNKFGVNGNNQLRCQLEMALYPEYIECIFKWTRNKDSEMMVGHISIMDKNNEKFKTLDVKVGMKGVDDHQHDEKSLSLEVEKNELFSRTFDLFPDNNLKILCNLKVFNGYKNISPYNILKQHQSMKDHFKKLLDSQVGTDVVFKVDNKEFKVHKSVMMARSPVFLAMFNNDMIENNSNQVKVEDMSSSTFKLLIEFIYTDGITTELDMETGIDLLKAASKYQLEGLETLCKIKLCDLLTVDNAMDTLVVAKLHNFTDLVESIRNFAKINEKEILSITNRKLF